MALVSQSDLGIPANCEFNVTLSGDRDFALDRTEIEWIIR